MTVVSTIDALSRVTPDRRSPIADWHEEHAAAFVEKESMRTPEAFGSSAPRAAPVTLEDVSWRRRLGCKGPGAPAWLAENGLAALPDANRWQIDSSGVLIARLGLSEFFIEAVDGAQARVEELRSRLPQQQVYPVIRQDFAMALAGKRAHELLLETCSVDFKSLHRSGDGTLALTSMIGVSVLVVPRHRGSETEYLIWCDPSFSLYLWTTLAAIARDLGGGVVAHHSNEGNR